MFVRRCRIEGKGGGGEWDTCLDVLHDHINVIRGLDDFIEADDVRMHKKTQDLDLPPHCTAPQMESSQASA